ncbi:hypothetical protein BDN70DRAFT_989881 [Pholiota conissans]|uniref:DUF6535 domain-containing protein n=1 Tax=Pholiota conissans TaxID=109636 RepID=A0A9P5ZCC1_9AGAR|nr:hypothetical protein BDN70DRAFT_989881 [Pholiota conissans]
MDFGEKSTMNAETGSKPPRESEQTLHPNVAPSRAKLGDETEPKRKILGLADPYQHASPNPDGDPWAIPLKPQTKIEIANTMHRRRRWRRRLFLLGFSVLWLQFSNFVVESYKFLQPDPNDAIVNLLIQIATGSSSNFSSPSSTP